MVVGERVRAQDDIDENVSRDPDTKEGAGGNYDRRPRKDSKEENKRYESDRTAEQDEDDFQTIERTSDSDQDEKSNSATKKQKSMWVSDEVYDKKYEETSKLNTVPIPMDIREGTHEQHKLLKEGLTEVKRRGKVTIICGKHAL